MSYFEFDANVSKKTRAMQQSAREFGMEVVRPAGIELDKIQDPADAIAEHSCLWDVFRTYRELGFHKLLLPPAFGGKMGKVPAQARRLIFEQLGYADAGLAISMDLSSMPFLLGTLSASKEVRDWARQYCQDSEANMIGCWAITEPDHGTDWIMATTKAGADPKVVPSLTAVKKGSEYVLNGRKSASITNGTIATHGVVHVGLDLSKGMHGSGLAICPLDLPGVSKGKPLDKLGKRPLNQGAIIFEDVRIPERYMLFKIPGLFKANAIGKGIVGLANSQMGLVVSSQARAIVDETLKYAKEHSCNGSALSEQQEIRLKLFDMFKAAESARRFAHSVAEHSPLGDPNPIAKLFLSTRATFWAAGNSIRLLQDRCDAYKDNKRIKAIWQKHNPGSGIIDWSIYGMASKVLATETAFNLAREALEVMGEDSLSTDNPLEKMLRDARTSMIEDGVNEALALAASEKLLA
ncbi:MAG: acyl-CoA dehydrogenase family protein [Gammaproteobacteria bacterium]